jgi:hypothetical protein
MADPYRDELMALREENARLRRIVQRRRARRAVLVVPAVSVLTFVAMQGIRPLLNAETDRGFFFGVACAVLVVVADVTCLLAVLTQRDGPDAQA